VTSNVMDVLRQDRDHVGEDVQSMDLQVNQLGTEPLANAGVGLTCWGIQVQKESLHELLLNQDLVGCNVKGVSGHMEHLTPKHAFQLQVLVSCGEEGLLRVLVAVNFIKHSVVNQLT